MQEEGSSMQILLTEGTNLAHTGGRWKLKANGEDLHEMELVVFQMSLPGPAAESAAPPPGPPSLQGGG